MTNNIMPQYGSEQSDKHNAMNTQEEDQRQVCDERKAWRERQAERKLRSSAWLLDRASGGTGRLERSQLSTLPRPARCGWPLTVPSIRLYQGRAFISGTEHCANPWACPTCTPILRANRAQDVQAAAEYWQHDLTHAMAFVTLTIPHHSSDRLRDMTRLVSATWSSMRGSHQWRDYSDITGIRHYIRTMEITWSLEHGWHAHLHVLLLLDHTTDWDDLQAEIYARWSETLANIAPQRKQPSRQYGVTVEEVRVTPERVADYMCKTPDRYGIASEMTRGDRKQGRSRTSINPLQLLDDSTIGMLLAHGHDARALWCEYVDATYRLRSITWSRRIRQEAGLNSEALTDRQIIDSTVHAPLAIQLTNEQHHMLRTCPNIFAFILQKTETGEIPLALQIINECPPPSSRI